MEFLVTALSPLTFHIANIPCVLKVIITTETAMFFQKNSLTFLKVLCNVLLMLNI